MKLNIQDRFAVELPADPDTSNTRRQVHEAAFSFVTPRTPSSPRLLHVAGDVAEMIGVSDAEARSDDFLEIFCGGSVPDGANPYAMCYGGHQFGNWAGQLGDGRAINLCEVKTDAGHFALQLKGAGETPYSRTADGLAVLRSSLREHLCSEAMHALGVPTTRSLSLITTGDDVIRDVMYSGHPKPEPGAVVCRVAESFIRLGNFEIFASRGDITRLRELTEYAIRHHYCEVNQNTDASDADRYVEFYRLVALRTIAMVIDWQRVGFVHGVMNTDNLSILGDTIDYGPYGWLEGYDHAWTPNTTDARHGRYRYGNQPQIAMWNLVQLANALVPIVGDPEPLQSTIETVIDGYEAKYIAMMRSKLGLTDSREDDRGLVDQLHEVLQLTETDMTIFFRRLAHVEGEATTPDVAKAIQPFFEAFYQPDELTGEVLDKWESWMIRYRTRRDGEEDSDAGRRIERMNAVNPKYVLRNYMAQLAIDKATAGDMSLIDELYRLLQRPYDEQPESQKWFAKRPDWARNKVGCSMLSCSS